MKLCAIPCFNILLLTAFVLMGCSAGQETPVSTAEETVVGNTGAKAQKGAEISTKEQSEFIERQKEEMRKQERELQDLRRQKFHDDYFRSQYQK